MLARSCCSVCNWPLAVHLGDPTAAGECARCGGLVLNTTRWDRRGLVVEGWGVGLGDCGFMKIIAF